MSASNYNWVCFPCRFVTREPKTTGHVPKCAECGADCFCLGYKVAVPRKSNQRAWKALHLESRRRELRRSDELSEERVRTTHAAERRIAHFQSLGPNKDREKLIKELKTKISASH